VLGKSLNVLSGLFVGVIVARYLGPKEYGLMNYVISYVSLFSVISNFGLDNIEIRELAKNQENRNAIIGSSLSLRLMLSLLTVIIIAFTLLAFESDSRTVILVIIYSLSLIFTSFNVVRNYFTSIVLNEYVVKTEIVRTLLSALLKISLLLLEAELIYFVIILSVDFIFLASGYVYSYRKKIDQIKAWYFDYDIAKELLKYSYPLFFSGSAIIVYQKVDQILIKNLIDDSSLGYYAVAARLTEFTMFFSLIISQTIGPVLIRLKEENEVEYEKKRSIFMALVFWSSFGVAIIMIVFAELFVLTLYGDEYFEAISVLRIIAIKIVMMGLFNCTTQIIIIENLQKYAVFRNLIGLMLSLVLNFLLIPKLGITGAAIATVLANLFSSYLSHSFIKQFRFLFKLQNKAIFEGLPLLLKIKKND
jgi:O-antigen/teichoic acid export membrane protein